jgi:Zn-dependent protease/CBS domain-containing protein
MPWSFRIARIGGTDVRIHITFLLLLLWLGWMYYQQGGWDAAIEGIVFILLLFLCVVLHEFGHALAARAFGIPTPDITLLPIGGVARLQRMPDKPSQELIVALAGPAVNVVIALLLFLYISLSGTGGAIDDAQSLTKLEDSSTHMAARLLGVNIMLVLFNMIPAFPMDGGRVLRALLAMMMPYARATQIAASIGQGLAFLFGFLGLLYNPMLLFIALFVYMGATYEATAAQMRELGRGLSVADALVTDFQAVRSGDTLDRAIDLLLTTSQHEFPVIDETGRVLGILTRDGLISELKKSGPGGVVDDAMLREVPSVRISTPFDHAFRTMNECQCPALPVLDEHGRLAGLFTPENVGEMMMIQTALGGNGHLNRLRRSRAAAA